MQIANLALVGGLVFEALLASIELQLRATRRHQSSVPNERHTWGSNLSKLLVSVGDASCISQR
jgi:hypothetical protein